MAGYEQVLIEHRGRPYKFYDEGSGQLAVLILHGIAVDKTWAVPAIDRWKQNFRCIAPDMPGHNGIPLSGIQNMGDFARYVKDLIDVLNLDNVVIFGFSMGGLIAAKYGELFPGDERVRGFVVWGSPVMGGEQALGGRARLIVSALKRVNPYVYKVLTRQIVLRVLSRLIGTPLDRQDAKAMSKFDLQSARSILEMIVNDRYMLNPSVEMLGVWGTKDPFVSERNYVYAKENKGETCEVLLVPHGGHFGPHDAIMKVYQAAESFFGNVGKTLILRVK